MNPQQQAHPVTSADVATAPLAGDLWVTGNSEADQLLNTSPLGLLIGMLLDQQVPLEWAFRGPYRLQERLGTELSAELIARYDPDALVALAVTKPALHRYPAAMAKRIIALCQHVIDQYEGDAAAVWRDAVTGSELRKRLRALPGFGDEKSRIFIAVLAKRFGVCPPGWEEAAGAFSDDQPRSVADIDSHEALARVKAWKKAQRAMGKRKDE